MGKSLIYNAIRTPDGTILNSKHRHNYIEHLDKNGEIYVIDGGLDYIRTSINKIPAESLVLYNNEPFKVIREFVHRGSRGKDGEGPLEYIKLKDISDEHLANIIIYDEKFNPNNNLLKYYKREKKFRTKSKGLELLLEKAELSTDRYIEAENFILKFNALNWFQKLFSKKMVNDFLSGRSKYNF